MCSSVEERVFIVQCEVYIVDSRMFSSGFFTPCVAVCHVLYVVCSVFNTPNVSSPLTGSLISYNEYQIISFPRYCSEIQFV